MEGYAAYLNLGPGLTKKKEEKKKKKKTRRFSYGKVG